MSKEVEMPSKNTVKFRGADDLEYGERKDLMKKAEQSVKEKEKGKEDVYGTVENLIVVLVESWSYTDKNTGEPLEIPSVGGIDLLRKVPNVDMNSIIELAAEMAKDVFGFETAPTKENEMNSDSPLDKSKDSKGFSEG